VTLFYIQQHPSVLEAARITKSCDSRVVEVYDATEILPKVALQKGQGTESENAYKCEGFVVSIEGSTYSIHHRHCHVSLIEELVIELCVCVTMSTTFITMHSSSCRIRATM